MHSFGSAASMLRSASRLSPLRGPGPETLRARHVDDLSSGGMDSEAGRGRLLRRLRKGLGWKGAECGDLISGVYGGCELVSEPATFCKPESRLEC